jgi:tetratricopeptide (TPR) repeat protein
MRSSIRSTIELLSALALLTVAPGALAQERSSEWVSQRARELVLQGEKGYQVGRFDEAIDAYSRAYAYQPLPALLFNLGQCHRQRGDLARAGFFYRRYLELAPEGRNAPVARELVARLDDAQARDDSPRRGKIVPVRAARPEVEPVAPRAEQPLYKRWWFWTGVGAVATVTVASAAVIASQPQGQQRTPSLGTGSFR